MPTGYYIVDPGVLKTGLYGVKMPGLPPLSFDDRTRILSYTARQMPVIATIPAGARFAVFPLRWHHWGEAYPSLGMYADHEQSLSEKHIWGKMSLPITDQVERYFCVMGFHRLLWLSEHEPLRWQDVLKPNELY